MVIPQSRRRGLLGVHVNDPAGIQIEVATVRQDVQG
jgi:hypothetical protein